MSGLHSHCGLSHDHHGHDHPDHTPDGATPPRRPGWVGGLRSAAAAVLLAAAGMASASVMVGAGSAVVITRFGEPMRVYTEPGLHWKWPAPIEASVTVDLRLHTTSSGLLDVGTRDGLRVLMQAYVAWQVPADPDAIRQFLRSVRNEPLQAARQLRTFLGSALEVTAGTVELASLLNTDPTRLRLNEVETQLRDRLEAQVAQTYGVSVRQVGLERLTLPAETMMATVDRLKAERETVAEERMAEGRRQAAEITSTAQRDALILESKAKQDAAETEAQSRIEAARIVGEAYRADPDLYTLLRSLETLEKVIRGNSHLILRTDAPPFRVLSDPPASAPASKPGPGVKP
jgi:membrane protease subunit HflC